MLIRRYVPWIALLAILLAGMSAPAASASPSSGPEGAFRGLTLKNCGPRAATNVRMHAYRDTELRLSSPPTFVLTGATRTVVAGVGDVFDRIVVKVCTDQAARTGLKASYPDSATLVGERRIVSAHVSIDCTGRSGALTVRFWDGQHASVPMEHLRNACSPPPTAAPLPEGPAGPAAVAPEALRRAEAEDDAEPDAFERLEVQNDHATKPVIKATARPFLLGAARTPITVENVPYSTALKPPAGAANDNGFDQAANHVCVEVQFDNKLHFAEPSLALSNGRRWKKAKVIVGAGGGITVDFVYYGTGTDTVTATTGGAGCRLTLTLVNGSGDAATATLCPARCDGTNELLSIQKAAGASGRAMHATVTGATSLHLCVRVGTTAAAEKRITVTAPESIRAVRVTIDANGAVAVTADAWNGSAPTIADDPACQ